MTDMQWLIAEPGLLDQQLHTVAGKSSLSSRVWWQSAPRCDSLLQKGSERHQVSNKPSVSISISKRGCRGRSVTGRRKAAHALVI